MPNDVATTIRYVFIASIAAASLFYVFGPSLIPNEEHVDSNQHFAVGLVNPANDCYINSVLQALAASSKLRAYLKDSGKSPLDQDVDEDLLKSRQKSVTEALGFILSRLNDHSQRGKTISARHFIHALEQSYRSRLDRRQQDAQEFLQLVVQKLSEEAEKRKKLQVEEQESHADDAQSSKVPGLPFEGKLESQIQCLTCFYRPPSTSSPFATLSLSVPDRGVTSLDACFDNLLKQETIDDYVCDQCKLNVLIDAKKKELGKTEASTQDTCRQELSELEEARETDPTRFFLNNPFFSNTYIPRRQITKHLRIAEYPDVLLVHLSRSVFNTSATKNTAKVQFSEYLKLGGFHRQEYRLVSVVSHRGGHNSGHYETFRRQSTSTLQVPDEKSENISKPKRAKAPTGWWAISDSRVRLCRLKDVLAMQERCYLLFYEKVTSSSADG